MSSNNFALTTLSENPEYFEEVIRLIEEEFHYNETNHFEKDFAPLVDPLNFENCFLFIDKKTNTVAAHLAVCPRRLIKNHCETPIAFIGGIVTHKKYRHQNLFKNLMEHAISTYAEKVSLFILWSDLEGLYERFNFYRSGGIIETGKKDLIASERPSGYEKTKFNHLSDEDFKNIISLYQNFNQKNFFTVIREEKDWSIIKEMNSIDLFIKRNLDGTIKSYFCANKGKDLTNIIHEVSTIDLSTYLSALKDISAYKTWLPESEAERFSSKEIFYTAFMRLGNLKLLNDFLAEVTALELRIEDINEKIVQFEFKNKALKSSAKEFLQYLFGPRPLEEFSPYQLSLYVTGADSI